MKSIENIETDRLIARRILPDDFLENDRMHQNPRVMATLGGFRSEVQTRQMLADHHDHWIRNGFGPWMWFSKADRQFVGRAGLKRSVVEGRDEVEIGYALMPEFWGQGLATEIAAASVNIAFTQLGLTDLVSFTLPTNLASRRVMEKCGFTFERDIVWKDLPHVLYRLKR